MRTDTRRIPRMHRLWLRLFAAAAVFGLSACRSTLDRQSTDKLDGHLVLVVATTTIVGDVVRQVAGDQVNLAVILPYGADPHSFEPRPQDLAVIVEADIIFASGARLEEFLRPLLESAGPSGLFVELSEGIELLSYEHDPEAEPVNEHSETSDPHTWMDPNNVIIWTEQIEKTLAVVDPEGAALYQANAESYRQSLQELDMWIREQVKRIPLERRLLVSDHRTLGYFAKAYGFEMIGEVTGSFSTNAQPSAQELAALEDRIGQFNVPAIFISETVNQYTAERVAEDTGIQLVKLYTGSLSEPGGPAEDYLSLLRYNVAAITAALGE